MSEFRNSNGGLRMKDFKDPRVWSKAHSMNKEFPREELFGITSQMRRAASSIGANIAEGAGRRSDGELTRFLHIARGSAAELEYQLLLARDLDLLSSARFDLLNAQVDEIQRMLTSLIQQVQPVQRAKRAAAR
ncbi:MAG: four helix bundle protein [Terriglobales bacterium]